MLPLEKTLGKQNQWTSGGAYFFTPIRCFKSFKNFVFLFFKDIDTELILWFNVCRLLVYFC